MKHFSRIKNTFPALFYIFLSDGYPKSITIAPKLFAQSYTFTRS